MDTRLAIHRLAIFIRIENSNTVSLPLAPITRGCPSCWLRVEFHVLACVVVSAYRLDFTLDAARKSTVHGKNVKENSGWGGADAAPKSGSFLLLRCRACPQRLLMRGKMSGIVERNKIYDTAGRNSGLLWPAPVARPDLRV